MVKVIGKVKVIIIITATIIIRTAAVKVEGEERVKVIGKVKVIEGKLMQSRSSLSSNTIQIQADLSRSSQTSKQANKKLKNKKNKHSTGSR